VTHRYIDLPPEALGFAHNSIDRADKYRDNAVFLEDARNYAASRTLVFIGNMPVIKQRDAPLDVLFSFNNVPFATNIGEPVFLGLENGNPRFAVFLPEQYLPELSVREDLKAIDLRTLAVKSLVTAQNLNLLATAQALLNWHNKHRFCANCGQKTNIKSAGWKRKCIICGTEHFPRTDPVVIMMATQGDTCLLGRSKHFPQGMYSCLAGFVEPGESIENAVRREILEETNVQIGAVSYHHSQPWPFPTSLMIGCLAKALSQEIKIDDTEIEDARWFSKTELAQIMAGTHKEGLTTATKMSIAHHLMQSFL
jgi:NAD+ diphosphatase